MKRFFVLFFTILMTLFVFAACAPKGDTIIVGAKNYTEQLILGNILEILVAENTDLKTRLVSNLASDIIFKAIQSGDVHLYAEYTGTIYGNYFHFTERKTADEIFQIARDEMLERHNILVLDKLGYNNVYTLSVRQDTAAQHNLRTFSDLAKVSSQLTLGATFEFLEREDGFKGLSRVYGMNFQKQISIDGNLRYTAIMNDEIQVTDAFSTDGMLLRFNLISLEDNLDFFPAYYAVPIIRQDIAEKYPQLLDVLGRLSGVLDEEGMQRLNYRVDVEQIDPRTVARDFLKSASLIP